MGSVTFDNSSNLTVIVPAVVVVKDAIKFPGGSTASITLDLTRCEPKYHEMAMVTAGFMKYAPHSKPVKPLSIWQRVRRLI